MLDRWGLRGAAAAYAAIPICVTLPLALFAIPRKAVGVRTAERGAHAVTLAGPERLVFMLLTTILIFNGLIVVNVSTWLFVFLQAQGLILAMAVALGALIGPAQVGARVLEIAGRRRHHPVWTLAASTVAIAAGLVLLALDLGVGGAALVPYGGGNGLFSITRGARPLAVFGSTRCPDLMGHPARPSLLAQAAAPALGAWLIGTAGTEATLGLIAGLAVANAGVLGLLWGAIRRPEMA